jgi:hypothetical protein
VDLDNTGTCLLDSGCVLLVLGYIFVVSCALKIVDHMIHVVASNEGNCGRQD